MNNKTLPNYIKKEHLEFYIEVQKKVLLDFSLENTILKNKLNLYKKWLEMPWYKKIFNKFIDYIPTVEEIKAKNFKGEENE